MGVFVSKMGESIEARIQASLNTAQDHDGAVHRVSERQVSGRSSLQDGLREEVLPQRHFGSRFHNSWTVTRSIPVGTVKLMNKAFASAENVMCTNTGYSGTAYYHASRNCGQACLDDNVYISCDSVVGSQAQANSCRFYSDATLLEKRHPSVERRLYRVSKTEGHCGPIMKEGCNLTFAWGEYSALYTLSWRNHLAHRVRGKTTCILVRASKASA